jgi:hypothetical protein
MAEVSPPPICLFLFRPMTQIHQWRLVRKTRPQVPNPSSSLPLMTNHIPPAPLPSLPPSFPPSFPYLSATSALPLTVPGLNAPVLPPSRPPPPHLPLRSPISVTSCPPPPPPSRPVPQQKPKIELRCQLLLCIICPQPASYCARHNIAMRTWTRRFALSASTR